MLLSNDLFTVCSHLTLEGLNFTLHAGQRDGIDFPRSSRHPYLKNFLACHIFEMVCDHPVSGKSFVAEQRETWSFGLTPEL